MSKAFEKIKKVFVEEEYEDDDDAVGELGGEQPAVEEDKIEIKYRGINSFKQVKELCECLRKQYPVVINLQSAAPDLVVRVTDYLSGVLDSIDGEIVAIGVNIWMCTPRNVVVEGKYVELVQQEAENKSYKGYPNRTANEPAQETMLTSPYGRK